MDVLLYLTVAIIAVVLSLVLAYIFTVANLQHTMQVIYIQNTAKEVRVGLLTQSIKAK